MPTEEWVLNWTNSIYPDRKRRKDRARQMFAKLIDEGYSVVDASELLVGNGVADINMADEMIAEASGISVDEPHRTIPRHYADVRDRIERVIVSLPSQEVMNIMVGDGRNRFAVGKLSKREVSDLDSLLRLARSQRGGDQRVMDAIHSAIESHVQNAILDTEALAGGEISFDWSGDGMTATASDWHGSYRISMKDDSCTCDRYVLGGFKHLGLMCEHVMSAHKAKAGNEWDDVSGTRKVFSQASSDGAKTAWCDRLRREIDITSSCVEAECPFFGGHGGDFIRCGFASR